MIKQQRAFTLVELSIVLVILGLLIGGVLTGQTLIRAAELRSVATQYNQYVTATHTFRDKYFALPGDMPNAQSYWGVQNASPSACVNASSTDSKTCNGNGDGQLLLSAGANEPMRFWQHLANAGLIEGSYAGTSVGGTSTTLNSPVGKISSSLWFPYYWGTINSVSGMFDGEYGNGLQIGGLKANDHPDNPLFKPEEAYNIDTKLDDGKPATGRAVMRAILNAGIATCTDASANSTLTANYLLSNSAITCAMVFRQVY